MAGKTSFFPTGKNCKIKVNGITLAYATDISYSVSIPHAAPKTLGTYEANSLEPMSYNVSGRFTVVRYVEGAVKRLNKKGMTQPSGASNDGNGIGSWTVNRGNSGSDILGRTIGAFGNDGKAHVSLDPSQLQEALTFDIEIYQKVPAEDSRSAITTDYTGVARIRNVRITNAAAGVPVRGVMTQTFDFMAIYLDEDTFLADASGIGQQFA
jgi:hypothetical protein